MPKSGFIAIVGRPNAGKSTLLNSILGTSLSIVTPKAQTTRERVLGILTEPDADKGQIVFIDTPGIHRARDGGINQYMVDEAKQALDAPSAVWYLIDPASKLEHEEEVLSLLKAAEAPVFPLLNKSDRLEAIDEGRITQFLDQVARRATELGIDLKPARRISASKGRGVKELVAEAWTLLPEGPLYYEDPDQLSDRPTRFFVAEKVREQLLLKLGEELPYSCAVEIENFDEKAKPIRIEATIHVERDSQKGMVIGKGGAKIKEIGQAARKEIEELVGAHVFLGLRVKVLKDWTRNPELMKRMGYAITQRKAPSKNSKAKGA